MEGEVGGGKGEGRQGKRRKEKEGQVEISREKRGIKKELKVKS